MQALTKKTVFTRDGEKTVSVHASDIRDLDINVDIMTVSSFYRDYLPVKGTLFHALLESVSKFGKMHFRRLELHFCVDFP